MTEPVTESPIFIVEAVKMAPEPERVIESVPEAKALDAIAVGVAVKLAKVPPTAATAITEVAARVRRIFDRGRFLSICVSVPFGFGGHAHLRLPRNGDGAYVGMNSVGTVAGSKAALLTGFWVAAFAGNAGRLVEDR